MALNEIPPVVVPVNVQFPGPTVSEYTLLMLRTGIPLSVSVMVNEKVPAWIGVPEISAVNEGEAEGVNVKPGGRLPVRDQVYGVVPLDPVRVAEYAWNCEPPERLTGASFRGGALSATSAVPMMMNRDNREMLYVLKCFERMNTFIHWRP